MIKHEMIVACDLCGAVALARETADGTWEAPAKWHTSPNNANLHLCPICSLPKTQASHFNFAPGIRAAASGASEALSKLAIRSIGAEMFGSQLNKAPCSDCEHKYWHDPECDACSEKNGYKYYNRRKTEP